MSRLSVSVINRHYFAALIASLIFFIPLTVQAQGGVGSTRGLPETASGIHTIQGRVYLPSGQRAGAGISVRLEGNVVGSRRSSTDLDGTFIFHSLPAADYNIVVEGGPDYEPARESVVIYGSTGGMSGASPLGQTMMLDIHLRPKGVPAENMYTGVPKPAVDSYKKGMEFVRSGDSKKAVEQLNDALAIYPNFPQAMRELGLQYLKLGQMDKAAETFEALLKLKPSDYVAHLNLGIALYNQSTALINDKKLDEAQKKLEGAETHLRQALTLNSGGPSAHYYLGVTLIKFRRFEEAQKEMELAISNGGENLAQAHRYLGGLYQSAHKNKEAADELEKYLKLDPKARDADTIRGIIEKLRKQ